MQRPTILHRDKTLYFTIRTFDPSDGVTPIDCDSDPTVDIRVNGADNGDSATVDKRVSSTGIYDCSYDPSGEDEGDIFTMDETATINSGDYFNTWEFTIINTTEQLVDAIWDELRSGHDTTDSFGEYIDQRISDQKQIYRG